MDFLDESPSDLITSLCLKTPELAACIFLKLANEEVFSKCALVCKSWNTFLTGTYFFEQFLMEEFGMAKTSKFIGIDGAVDRLSNLLRGSPFFRQLNAPFVAEHRVLELKLDEAYDSLAEFVEAVRQRYDLGLLLQYDVCYYCDFDIFCLMNVSQMVPFHEITDILRIQFAIPGDASAHSYKYFPVALLDKNLNTLSESSLEHNYNKNPWTLISEYPAGVRFFAFSGTPFPNNVRCLLPSRFRKLQCFQELLSAAMVGDVEKARGLMQQDPSIVSFTDHCGLSSLEMSIEFSDENTMFVELLLDHNAKVVIGEHFSALRSAARRSHFKTLRLLVERGLATKDDLTFAFCTIFTRDGPFPEDVAQFLFEKGADPNGYDSHTPLARAVHNGNIEAVAFLLSHGVNASSKFEQEWSSKVSTALIEAVLFDNIDMVQFLLKHKADKHAKDSDGWTAIQHAEKLGYDNIVKLLLLS